ncbi:MAG: sigma-70 family RNA polymerase sigma factor [Balneolaceae bacterium]|nr:MAG: sigma-70 family RNA polymerase sigma factor [Balneolaceae bacterium]
MDNQKLSGAEFYELVKTGDSSEVNRVSRGMVRTMALFLRSTLNAEEDLAMDCAQEVYQNVYVKILENSLPDVNNIFGYLINSARNEFLKSQRRGKFEVPSEHAKFIPIKDTSSENIVELLYNREREKKLEECIRKLKIKKRIFFKHVLEYINEKDKDTAKLLGMSHSNFRAKKSRLIDSLRECVKEASHS